MMDAETCATGGCRGWPEYPDVDGRIFCRRHYDAPNDGEFTHIPNEERRAELQEKFNR